MQSLSVLTPTVLISLLLGGVFLISGILLILHGRRSRQQATQASGAVFCSAQVADVRITQAAGFFITELALIFTGADGMQHRAFLSVSSAAPLNTPVGSSVQIAVFPAPLAQVPHAAFDPMRGADGRLPGNVMKAAVNGIPLDETGTVMLAADYPRFQIPNARSGRGAYIAGIVLAAIGVCRLLMLLRLLFVYSRYTKLF